METPSRAEPKQRPWTFWWMVASALAVCVGSLGPWETFVGSTLYGFDRGGIVTLFIGVAALVLLIIYARTSHPGSPVALVLGAGIVVGALGAYYWWDAKHFVDENEFKVLEEFGLDVSVSVEWGLVLVTVGGLSLALAALATVLGRAGELQPASAADVAAALAGGGPQAADADPTTGARLAGYWRRIAGGLVDAGVVFVVLVLLVVGALVFSTEDPETGEFSDGAAIVLLVALLTFWPVYQWLMIGRWGQTLGKMALGIKVVRSEDAMRVSYRRSFGRVASIELLGFFTLPLLLAILYPLWDRRRQTLYDKMASTIVIRVRP